MAQDSWLHRALRSLVRAMDKGKLAGLAAASLVIVGIYLTVGVGIYLYAVLPDMLEGQGGSGILGQIIMSFIAGHVISKWTEESRRRRAHEQGFCIVCKHKLDHKRYFELKELKESRPPNDDV